MARVKALACLLALCCWSAAAEEVKHWTRHFDLSGCEWSSAGKNDYFILEPGYTQTFEGRDAKLQITVLTFTKRVDGIETRIVEEREWHGGELVEVSRNLFAVCRQSNDIFYFGEEVDFYKSGKLSGHEGTWEAGVDGALPGLFMPACPLVGARFYQEVAPKVAMDRVEIVSEDEAVNTAAGKFIGCVLTEETTPLEPGAKDSKAYARGVGLVRDGDFGLSDYRLPAGKK